MITVLKENTGLIRSVKFSRGRFTVGFGVFRWPWVRKGLFYRTTLANIIDLGFVKWLAYPHYRKGEDSSCLQFRLMCVAVGVEWRSEVTA